MKMKKAFLVLFCTFITIGLCLSQKIDKLDSYLFSIPDGKYSIQFIKTDTDLDKAKPTILFCQGSLPIPLVIEDNNDVFLPAFNFDYKKLSEKYNIILISSPHTPIKANVKNLNPRYAYVPDVNKPFEYDEKYLEDNYLDKYVERADKVIAFLLKQPWVQKDKIYVMGHSQGANVAAKIASTNSDITALGYFSGNPDGRITGIIRSERQAAIHGKISAEEAQKNIDRWYFWFKSFAKNEIPGDYQGDSPHTWASFSTPMRDKLVNLAIPVYITYGTMDMGAEGCDVLPIYFELEGKTNYKMKPFVGYGHNFEQISPDGKSNFENMKWKEAMDNFTLWLESLTD